MEEGAANDRAETMHFEPPPKYLGSLINSINDGAKAAQTSAIFLAFVGLYLSATAISVSDEDLLRGAAIQLSQLGGVSIPVIVSFLLGPILFFVLHASLLIRYGMLVTSLQLFRDDVRKTVPDDADRARCRNLLATVDFVLMIAGQDDPRLRAKTRLYRWNVFVSIAALPVAVLLAVQISFLRYQSEAITWTQRAVLTADLLMLVAFYYWLWHGQQGRGAVRWRDCIQRVALYSLLPLAILIINLSYFGVPDARAQTVRFWDLPSDDRSQPWWQRLVRQPLDLLLCPGAHWGCRYLSLPNRALVATSAGNAIEKLRTRPEEINEALTEIGGLSTRTRTLRFANFNQSRAYAIDLVGSDLRHATFWSASVQGAKFSHANLQGANFDRAQMQGADLNWADLKGAALTSAQLQGATMIGVDLQGADVMRAQLQGAELAGARLQGSDLTSASLVATSLREAHLAQVSFDDTDLDAADLRRLQTTARVSEEDRAVIVSALAMRNPASLGTFRGRLDDQPPPIPPRAKTTVLVGEMDARSPLLSRLQAVSMLLLDAAEPDQSDHFYEDYVAKLVKYARADPAVAAGLTQRATAIAAARADSAVYRDRAVYVVLICRLLQQVEMGKLQLPAGQFAQMKVFRAACG